MAIKTIEHENAILFDALTSLVGSTDKAELANMKAVLLSIAIQTAMTSDEKDNVNRSINAIDALLTVIDNKKEMLAAPAVETAKAAPVDQVRRDSEKIIAWGVQHKSGNWEIITRAPDSYETRESVQIRGITALDLEFMRKAKAAPVECEPAISIIAELISAMHKYEEGTDEFPPFHHRDLMRRAKAFVATKSTPVEYGVIKWPEDDTGTANVTIKVSDQENISEETRRMVLALCNKLEDMLRAEWSANDDDKDIIEINIIRERIRS